METILGGKCEPSLLSPLTLAFIGDTVYDLLVREKLVNDANRPAKKLHEDAVGFVRASAQREAAEVIRPLLTDEEEGILKRGRNAHVSHLPKNGTVSDYHYATAVEALFGYLYLCGRTERLRELFAVITDNNKRRSEALPTED